MKPEIRLKARLVYNTETKRRATYQKYETVKRGVVCLLPQLKIAVARGQELEEAFKSLVRENLKAGYLLDVEFGILSLEVAGDWWPATQKHLHKPEDCSYEVKFKPIKNDLHYD